ncbi:MAG: hypothetical protein ACR2OT_06890 [Parvibaculales bacterium]
MPPNFDDILSTIEQSDPKNDWVGVIFESSLDYYVYKDDVNLRIEELKDYPDSENESSERELFSEPWLDNLPNNRTYRRYYKIYFNSSILIEIMLLSVDGGRATIPLPVSRDNLRIRSSLDLAVAKIVGNLEALDKYLERLKLTE